MLWRATGTIHEGRWETIAFNVVTGGGPRHYRLVVYGPQGIVTIFDGLDVTLDDGVQEVEPAASISLGNASPVAGGSLVTLALSSNATASDPTVLASLLDPAPAPHEPLSETVPAE